MTFPANQIGHVWLNFRRRPQSNAEEPVYCFSSRACGRPFGIASVTGCLRPQNAGNELVRVDLTSPGTIPIWLWFTPNDLYVRGVAAAGGTTYMFNEPSVNITGVHRFNSFGDVQKKG